MWQDTVLKLESVTNESLRIQMTKILETQAKASYEAGIKTVVEWLKKHTNHNLTKAGIFQVVSTTEEWQSFLKGIGV